MTIDKICKTCLTNADLYALSKPPAFRDQCDYCGKSKFVKNMDDIAVAFDEKFQEYYGFADGEYEFFGNPDNDDDDRVEWVPNGSSIDELIVNIVECDYPIVEALMEKLEENCNPNPFEINDGAEEFYSEESSYDIRGVRFNALHEKWENVVHQLKYVSRYCNPLLDEMTKELFSCLEIKSIQKQVRKTSSELGIDILYRARRVKSEQERKKVSDNIQKEMGAPPSEFASYGRMNPQGISVFYGAKEIDTCISEIRPAVGNMIATAAFRIPENLNLLCLDNLNSSLESIFSKHYDKYSESIGFLKVLSRHISEPMSLSKDITDLTYLTTCYFSEYIKNVLKYDGIVYPSVQRVGGQNVAIFNPFESAITYKDGTLNFAKIDSHKYDWSYFEVE